MFLWSICFVCGSLSYLFVKSVLFNENNLTKNLSQNLRPIKNKFNEEKKKWADSLPKEIYGWQISI